MKIIAKFFLFSLLTISYAAYCQKKNEFGIVLQGENTARHSEEINPGATKNSHTDWRPGFGAQYERILGKHSSAILGVKYRSAINDIYIAVPTIVNFTDYAHFLVKENFLTMPVQYKYSFSFVSISAGTSLDYFLSWKDLQKYYYAPLQSYDRFLDKKLSIGLLGSISKKISIDKKVMLEPTVYYNRILSFDRTYFGGSLEIKYKL